MGRQCARVLIAEQYPLVAGFLRKLVASAGDLEVVGEVESGAELTAFVATHELDVLLLGMNVRDANSLELVRRVHTLVPRLPVCLVSFGEDPRALAMPAFRAGASGLVTRMSAPEAVIDAIRALVRGERFADCAAVDGMMIDAAGDRGTGRRTLSPREFQVLQMLAFGKGTGEIAAALNLSPKTVSTHKTRLCQKLRLQSIPELVHFAIEHRLAGHGHARP